MKKLGIVTGRPYRQSISLAVSLAQGGNLATTAPSPASRNGGVGSGHDDDDSMDVHAHHLPLYRNGHFRPRASTLEELSLYFATSPAAAAAAELALSQHQQARADDAGSAAMLPAPMDLSQNYERVMRIAEVEGQQPAVETPAKTAELLAEKTA